MTETLEETPKKRETAGVSSCDKSPISNTSPETKKSRSGEHAVCFHEVSKQEAEEDVILYTLRWFETVSSTWISMGRYSHSLSLDATTMVS